MNVFHLSASIWSDLMLHTASACDQQGTGSWVGSLAERMEVWSLSPAALHLNSSLWLLLLLPLLPAIFQSDPQSKPAQYDPCVVQMHSWWRRALRANNNTVQPAFYTNVVHTCKCKQEADILLCSWLLSCRKYYKQRRAMAESKSRDVFASTENKVALLATRVKNTCISLFVSFTNGCWIREQTLSVTLFPKVSICLCPDWSATLKSLFQGQENSTVLRTPVKRMN